MATFVQFGFADTVPSATAVGTLISNSHGVVGFDPFPVAADQLSVVSSSILDAPGQGGAEVIAVSGLRLTGPVHFEEVATIQLNGTTPVDSWSNAFRANSALIVSGPTGSTNIGDIDITIGGTHVLRISAGLGMSAGAHFSLPDDKNAVFVKAVAQMVDGQGSSPRAVLRAFVKRFDGPWLAPAFPVGVALNIGIQRFTVIGPEGPTFFKGSDFKVEITKFNGTSASLSANVEIDIRNAPSN